MSSSVAFFRKTLWFLVFLSLFAGQSFAQCQQSLNVTSMNQDFIGYFKRISESYKEKIVILPFFDNGVDNLDGIIAYSLSFAIYDMFANANANLVNPYLSSYIAKSQNISGANLATVATAKKIAEELKARFVIFGSFQKLGLSDARFFVSVYDSKEEKATSPAVQFAVELNDSLLNNLQVSVKKAFANVGAANALKTDPQYEFPRLQAFRFYGKGLELASEYDMSHLELSVVWFEKALKETYHHFNDAALSMARAYFMMAILQKNQHSMNSLNWSKGLEALSFFHSQQRQAKSVLTYRFISGNTAFLNGITSWQAGKRPVAADQARQGMASLPEDGMLQNLYLLSNSGLNTKNNVTIGNPVCF